MGTLFIWNDDSKSSFSFQLTGSKKEKNQLLDLAPVKFLPKSRVGEMKEDQIFSQHRSLDRILLNDSGLIDSHEPNDSHNNFKKQNDSHNNFLKQNHAHSNLSNNIESHTAKQKFQRELFILAIGMSCALLAFFIPLFIYYFKQNVLNLPEDIVDNQYIIVGKEVDESYLNLFAIYAGNQISSYPNISPYLSIKVMLSVKNNLSYLSIEFDEYKHESSSSQDKSTPLKDSSQFIWNNIVFGPFNIQYADVGSNIALVITRQSTGEKIFDTLDFQILFSQYFSTFGTFLPSSSFYGLGQQRTPPQEKDEDDVEECTDTDCVIYDYWNRITSNGEVSGYQPLYLVEELSGKYSLFFIDDAFSGLSVKYSSLSTHYVTLTSYGPKISLRVFMGESGQDTVSQYHQYLDGWGLIPFWGMGYHHGTQQSSEASILKMLTSFQNNGLSVDSVWTGVGMNDIGNQFSIQNPKLVQIIKNAQLKWVPVMPYSLSLNSQSPQYVSAALGNSTLIISNKTKLPLLAEGYEGKAYFLDFNHVNASQVWEFALNDLWNQVQFDALWLTHNQPFLQQTGEYILDTSAQKDTYSLNLTNGMFDSIFSSITSIKFNQNLLNTDALHYNQPDAPFFYTPSRGEHQYERDMHSQNGYMQTQTTHGILKELIGVQMPFIISDSNRPGSGSIVAQITSCILGNWECLQLSFSQQFDSQIFGLPFNGSDMCPLHKTNRLLMDIELCARWYQTSSVFPLMRFYPQSMDQEDPLNLKQYSYLIDSIKNSLVLRYSLLKHYYSLYILKKGIGIVFQPLHFVYPEVDNYPYFGVNSNNTALIGDSLFVYTVMIKGDSTSNSTSVQFVVPPNLWVELEDPNIQFKGPLSTRVKVAFSRGPFIFLKEGHLILQQRVQSIKGIQMRSDLLDSNFILKGVLKTNSQDNLAITYGASGMTLGILDYNSESNISICLKSGCELHILVDAVSKDNNIIELTVTFTSEEDQFFQNGITITEIQLSGIIKYAIVFGVENPFDLITLNQTLSPDSKWIINEKQQTFKLSLSF